MSPTSMVVGDLVRHRRISLGWSVRDLSRLSAVACKTLHTLEDGSRSPREATARKVEAALGGESGSINLAREGNSPTVITDWSPPPIPRSAPKPGIGAIVRHRRIELGLTHADIAALVGMNSDSISQIEANEFIPGQTYHTGFDEALRWSPSTLASHLPDSANTASSPENPTALPAIGQRISHRRRQQSLTQRQLAEILEVSRRTIINIEADRHPPRPRLRVLIEQTLGWPQGALLLPDRD